MPQPVLLSRPFRDDQAFELHDLNTTASTATATTTTTTTTAATATATAARAQRRRLKLERLREADEMKFSHSLQFNAVPDWSNHYIAYSNLKKQYVHPHPAIARLRDG